MEVVRYDGTRLMNVYDVDEEFFGHCVLLDNREFPNTSEGYLLASAKGEDEAFQVIWHLKMNELDGKGLVVTGSKMRGEMVLGIYGCP